MKLKKRLMSLLLAAVLAVGSFMAAPVEAQAAAKGVDVSKYQGLIDWNAVKNAGYSFAFVKIGSAKSSLDPYYAYNLISADAVGMKVGAYVYSYATTVEGAIEEARFAIAALAPFAISLPVVYDLEDEVHKNMTPDQLAALAVAFCSTVEAAGYYPMLYASQNWATQKIASVPYDKWIAKYSDTLEYPNAAFWQYTSKGSVPGIAGNVDLNYQYKDYSKLIIKDGFVDRNGKRYYYQNYKKQYGFIQVNGLTYFMNADGSMFKEGWIGDGVNMWYMDTKDGHMLRDLVKINGKYYYFGDDGLMRRGLTVVNGSIYMFGADGAMHYGWYADASGMRYFMEDGKMASNTTMVIDGVPFVFDVNGLAAAAVTAPADQTAAATP